MELTTTGAVIAAIAIPLLSWGIAEILSHIGHEHGKRKRQGRRTEAARRTTGATGEGKALRKPEATQLDRRSAKG